MGVLPIGSPETLLPTKCPAYARGLAGQPRRDIRADTEGGQEAQPTTCTPIVAMSGCGRSPSSGRGTSRSAGF